MKWLKRIYADLPVSHGVWKKLSSAVFASVMLSVAFLTAGGNVFAQDADGIGDSGSSDDSGYTYTVRLSAGNQGVLTGKGVDAPAGAKIEKSGDQLVISGVGYNEVVYIYPEEAAEAKDARYSVRGIRRSGRDNSEAVQATGPIASDLDYVIAYRVSGKMVKYTVNYLDATGNRLLESNTYYGNPGERQYVSARYVDGYLPQAYNLVKTLSANEAENVFDFQYTPLEAPVTTVTEEAGPTTVTTTPTADVGAAGTGAGVAAAPVPAGADAGAATPVGVGGDVTPVPDEDVPQANAPEDEIDLDDDPVPLASGAVDSERPGTMVSYLPVYIGIGAAAAVALAATAVYLRKKRRIPASEVVEKLRSDEDK
ncbi:MAG: hypothetical protein K1W22_12685 [Lachnospiraceae bacterium]